MPWPSGWACAWSSSPLDSASGWWASAEGETDYRINAIPLGGYVKMSGENPMDERSDDPREFMNHSRWHRFLIAIAGPTMNILLAIVPC